MSNSRRTIRPVRQLSLQQPGPRRQHIRRQRSAEDEKSLRIYANSNTYNRVRTNIRNEMEKPKVRVAWTENHHNSDDLEQVEVVARQIPRRSRPTTGRSTRSSSAIEKASILCSRQELTERLRLAWKHREEKKANIDIFLAHGTMEERCDSELSMSVPLTPLPKKLPGPVKDQKQISWNFKIAQPIDINQTNVQERLNDYLEESKNNDLKNQIKDMHKIPNNDDREHNQKVLKISSKVTEEKDSIIKESEDRKKVSTDNIKKEEKEDVIEKHSQGSMDSYINKDTEEKKKACISINCTNLKPATDNQSHSPSVLPSVKQENITTTKIINNSDFSLAKQKRANFQSRTNRAFLVPMIEKSSKELEIKCPTTDKSILAKPTETRCASASDKNSLQKQTTERRLSIDKNLCLTIEKNTAAGNSTISEKARRTSSAPPQRRGENTTSKGRLQVNIVIDAPSLPGSINKSVICDTQEKPVENDKVTGKIQENPTKVSRDRSIRSASIKRRSKSTKRRFLLSEFNTKDEEDTKNRKRCERRVNVPTDARTSDVVTMVSLVSSADSDSDMENTPDDDKLINELRTKLPTIPIIKTSINSNSGLTKKPIKSVSFQKDSFDEDLHLREPQVPTKEEKRMIVIQPCFGVVNNHVNETEDSLSWKQDVPDITVLPISALIQKTEKPLEIPLTDREKRCLAVPIDDLYDKKRKLPQTRSTHFHSIISKRTSLLMETKDQRPQAIISRADSLAHSPSSMDNLLKVEHFPNETLTVEETTEKRIVLSSEPHFQTTKEKECWHLYRKMCNKGVCVSFDTVLRGMLTPTEYRLRQKELSQDIQ